MHLEFLYEGSLYGAIYAGLAGDRGATSLAGTGGGRASCAGARRSPSRS